MDGGLESDGPRMTKNGLEDGVKTPASKNRAAAAVTVGTGLMVPFVETASQ